MFHYVSMFKQGTAARKDAAPFAHRPMQILIFSAPRLLSLWNSFQIFSSVPYVFHHFWNFSPEAQRSFPAFKQSWLQGHSQGLWLTFPWGIVAKDLGRSAKVRQGPPRNAKERQGTPSSVKSLGAKKCASHPTHCDTTSPRLQVHRKDTA